MILGQLRMIARQTKNALLQLRWLKLYVISILLVDFMTDNSKEVTQEVKKANTWEANKKSKVSTDGWNQVGQLISLQLLLPEKINNKVRSCLLYRLLTVQKSLASWKRPSGFHSWGLHQDPGCQSRPTAWRGGCPGSTWCSCRENLGSGIWPSPTAHSLKCGEWIIHKWCHQHGSCQMIVIEISMELQLLLVTIYFPFWYWQHGGPIQTPCSYAKLEIGVGIAFVVE